MPNSESTKSCLQRNCASHRIIVYKKQGRVITVNKKALRATYLSKIVFEILRGSYTIRGYQNIEESVDDLCLQVRVLSHHHHRHQQEEENEEEEDLRQFAPTHNN